MYTGTLISDLMKMADQVGFEADRQLREELHEIFTMQIPATENDQAYQGAA